MKIDTNNIIFQRLGGSSDVEIVLPTELDYEPMVQFINSGYLSENTLPMDQFLDEDNTIDLEKLELAICLTIDYLEFSIKKPEPIYVFLGNMDKYFQQRRIDGSDVERIIEESSFILGFCNSVAQENKLYNDVIVQFRGRQ